MLAAFWFSRTQKGKAQVHNMGCPHRTLHRILLIGNPSSDLLVKQYLKEFTAEQLRASIAPKQAVPPFAFAFSTHRENVFSSRPSCQLTCLSPPEIKRSSRLFSLLMTVHCGDLGQVKISDTARFPDGNGFLSHLGKDFEGWRLQPL